MENNGKKVTIYGWNLKHFPKPGNKTNKSNIVFNEYPLKIILFLVLKIWKKLNKWNDGQTPERLIHVGVAVFNQFYHFNQKGCQTMREIVGNFPFQHFTIIKKIFCF